MKIFVGSIGRLKKGPEQELVKRYHERLQKGGKSIGINQIEVIELTESRATSAAQRKEAESQALLERLPDHCSVVLFDERGKSVDSRHFAKTLARANDGGVNMAFLIGGPDGHAPQLRAKADYVFSFGALTMPHQLVRVLVFEQLYRATTILTNHPYHRD